MAASNVVIKLFPRAHPLATNAVAMGVACLVLLVASVVTGESLRLPTRAETWLAVAYVSVIGSVVVFSLFLFIIARWSASASSYVMLVIPLVTVIAASALDHETVTLAYFVGGPLVLAGVYVGAFARPLLRFHPRRLGGLFVTVALQVQHAVDDKVRAMRGERFALLHGLASQHRGAEHDITATRAMFIIVHERQHVGGTVLAAMPTIERAAFGFLDEPKHDPHVRRVRN